MKLFKKTRAVVHALMAFVQTHIALVPGSVVGLSLTAGTRSEWIDEFAEISAERRMSPLPAGYQAHE
jgi:hypothetical protein